MLKIITAGFLLYIYSGGAVEISAQTWEFVGLDSMVIKHLYVSGDTMYAGTAVRSGANVNSGLYFTSDGGNRWLQLDSSLGSGNITSFSIDKKHNNSIFIIKGFSAYSSSGILYKSTDGGKNWAYAQTITQNVIQWFGISPFNKYEMYFIDVTGTSAGVLNNLYKSTDGGNTWTNISAFPASSHGSALTFAFDQIDSMSLYVTVDTQFDQYLYKSTNKGESWNYVSQPPISPLEMKADIFLPDRIYLYSYYKATDDGGFTWYDAYNGLANNIDYLSFYQDKETTKLLYVLRKDGLYSSTNDTIFWQLVDGSDELPIYFGPTGFYSDRYMSNIFIEPVSKSNGSFGELYLGTAEGIYKTSIVTKAIDDDKQPRNFSLNQNFPNPFNPSTIISYHLAEGGVSPKGGLANYTNVELKVYDILGNEITTLVKESQTQGDYKIEFNGKELPSGVYIYRLAIHADKLTAGTSSFTRKMLLLK